MARPRIGIFGALVAVGGVLAWRWGQKHRTSQARLASELNRWEGEGGALAPVTPVAQAAPPMPALAVAPRGTVANGRDGPHAGGTRDTWPFPHG
jgi:hypothetical protein